MMVENLSQFEDDLEKTDGCPFNNNDEAMKMRVSSSIRKTGTDSTWQYPSMEIFKKAIERKHGPIELDSNTLDTIVHMHNVVNEQAWQEILKYERFHMSKCACKESPFSLTSFQGKPNQLSLKARMLSLLGYKKPFDRHDWIVDRCGLKSVRYIIDFYNGSKMLEKEEIPSVYLDVRPAPTLEGCIDRLRMSLSRLFAEDK